MGDEAAPGNVRLTLQELDLMRGPGPRVVDLTGELDDVVASARAWATVRGFTDLDSSMADFLRTFPDPAPEGFMGMINKRHQLYLLITWPWAPASYSEGRSLPR